MTGRPFLLLIGPCHAANSVRSCSNCGSEIKGSAPCSDCGWRERRSSQMHALDAVEIAPGVFLAAVSRTHHLALAEGKA